MDMSATVRHKIERGGRDCNRFPEQGNRMQWVELLLLR
jgi:hypothetical protein